MRFGVAYASSVLTEENRTLALPLDRIWGAGSGVAFQWTDGRIVALDLTYYNLGGAPSNVTVPGVGTVLSALTGPWWKRAQSLKLMPNRTDGSQ